MSIQTNAGQSEIKTPPQKTRHWRLRIRIILLLLIQALVFFVIVFKEAGAYTWGGLPVGERSVVDAGYILIITLGLALMALLGISFLQSWGWLLAMMTQAVTLLGTILLHFWWDPGFIYPIMIYAILMVLYLNSLQVRTVFHAKPSQRDIIANDELTSSIYTSEDNKNIQDTQDIQ